MSRRQKNRKTAQRKAHALGLRGNQSHRGRDYSNMRG